MTNDEITAREVFIKWQKAGKEPKRRSTAIKKISEYTKIDSSVFDGVALGYTDPATGREKIDDGLAFMYWDITENGARAIGANYHESDRARVLFLLRIARGIVSGQRVRIQTIELAGGGHPILQESFVLPRLGRVAIADMRPAQIHALAYRRFELIRAALEKWRAIMGAPEVVRQVAIWVRELMDEWVSKSDVALRNKEHEETPSASV